MAETFTDKEPWVDDSYAIWNFIELDMGIIAASLPATKPLFSWIYNTAKSLTKGNKTTASKSNNAEPDIDQPQTSEMKGFVEAQYRVTSEGNVLPIVTSARILVTQSIEMKDPGGLRCIVA